MHVANVIINVVLVVFVLLIFAICKSGLVRLFNRYQHLVFHPKLFLTFNFLH